MKFQYQKIDDLPKLAWMASIPAGSDVATVLHGPYVETRDQFFIEGAWNGRYEEEDFDKTDCVSGSGGRLRGEMVVRQGQKSQPGFS